MVNRVRERMDTYTIALKPSTMERVRDAADREEITVRLWIREAITMRLTAQDEIAERKRQLLRSQAETA